MYIKSTSRVLWATQLISIQLTIVVSLDRTRQSSGTFCHFFPAGAFVLSILTRLATAWTCYAMCARAGCE